MEEEGVFLELLSSGDGGEDGFLLGCSTTSHMLCFGAGASSESSLSSLSSSPPPTITTSSIVTTTISKSTKKGGSSGGGGRRGITGGTNNNSSCGSPGTASKKKARIITESSAPTSGTMRVRKEKLGERIMALQQLVSPFGKSDTASVLHEALGYIRFLHDQVQVLSLPYMQSLATPAANLHDGGGGGGGEGELRRRGLCLVPLSCTENVANNNGADIWSPSSMGSNISSVSKN
ncbi:hypothetical protein J5N97_008484 [Dioscorea zingiberensis]|uniref:BHLH domain-containing protein n=1 Tax=Dioscorea zingiberensis TaxID=325984 RepID=A0A9D5CW86_9LILI|nr:hypothetical protein J5N97_008484 [Dioscorea zingiberensis]